MLLEKPAHTRTSSYTPVEVGGMIPHPLDQISALSYQATGGYSNQYLTRGNGYGLMGQMFPNNQYNSQAHIQRL